MVFVFFHYSQARCFLDKQQTIMKNVRVPKSLDRFIKELATRFGTSELYVMQLMLEQGAEPARRMLQVSHPVTGEASA